MFLVRDVVFGGEDTNIFIWQDGSGGTSDGNVEAGELVQLGRLDGFGSTELNNLDSSNFII